MTDGSHQISLKLPATREDLLVARMALSGLGMLAGLDVDLIGDLRTVVNECCDCLLSRAAVPEFLLLEAGVQEKRLSVRFSAQGSGAPASAQALDMEIERAVLETLMPEVKLFSDENGVSVVECSMPI